MENSKFVIEKPSSVKTTIVKDEPIDGSITVKEFLDFLKTAYQVNGSVENFLLENGCTRDVDWIRLKESKLVQPRSIACQTLEILAKEDSKEDLPKKKSQASILSTTDAAIGAGFNLKEKLGDVLSEGILDSVLTYMAPSNTSITNPPPPSRRSSQAMRLSDKGSHCSVNSHSNEKSVPKRKSLDMTNKASFSKFDSEILIHVCDEVKNAKKDFTCNQYLLVEKMGYFAEVTAGQRLEDMDISVHCDIAIFEWLMRWVKKELPPEDDCEEGPPELDAHCVISVLVSAAFLQMDPLLQECLLFCHRNMNDVLKTSTNLSCLNDSIMTRLAAMYTNSEIEAVRDRKDKIQCRLYCKLIQSLCESEPESMRGHWSSLAYSYRCGRCKQLVSPSLSPEIPCVPACMRILCDGSVTYIHERDPRWNINDYIEGLFKSLKTWRKVYWHLWGDAHFLYCTVCKRYFPANQIAWCRFHPDPPQFFTVDAQKASLPVGRFPCCGERAYKFQLLEGESGCQFREHTPSSETVRDTAVITLLENNRMLVEEEAPKLMFPERLTRLVAKAGEDKDSCEGKSQGVHHFWWEGLELIPQRPQLGLLGGFSNTTNKADYESLPQVEIPDIPEDDYLEPSDSSLSTYYSSSEEHKSVKSEDGSSPEPVTKPADTPKHRAKKRHFRFWQHNLSARSNQDIQRSHEESTLKQISTILGRKTVFNFDQGQRVSNKMWPRHITPAGGVWVRLESEWRERNNLPQVQRTHGKQKNKTKIT